MCLYYVAVVGEFWIIEIFSQREEPEVTGWVTQRSNKTFDDIRLHRQH